MITSIAVTGCYNIGMNSNKKIKIGEQTLSVEKDIPFIRYRFDKYDESSLSYIDKMMKQFDVSTHLLEIGLNTDIEQTLQLINAKFSNVAKYIYIDITEDEVQAKQINADKLALIGQTISYSIDRYMLKDKSVSLDTITVKTFTKSINKAFGIKEDNIGVCSSPLSFSDLACLTAVKARELMSLYSPVADVALPSANHQCMNCCGCIRYMIVDHDIEAPAEPKPFGAPKKEKNTNNSESDASKSNSNKVKPKSTIVPGMFNL